MTGNVLDVAHLAKRYGSLTAVRDLTFTVEPGEVLGFLGPNGAGKTSTLRMILGILKPDAGTIRLFGQPWSMQMQPRIGYLPEERGLYRGMKAADAVAYFARLKGLDSERARRGTDAMLERLGLASIAGQRIESLSKGLAQKVQLAAAIAHAPDLLILDEPFSGLDPLNQQIIEAIIADEARAGRSTIFSTHTMQHAERLCRRVVILRRGAKVFDGTVDAARRLLPRRVRVEAAENLSFLAELAGVISLAAPLPGSQVWEAVLANGAEPLHLLAACIARGTKPIRFDAAEPTLHEAFMAVAGVADATAAA